MPNDLNYSYGQVIDSTVDDDFDDFTIDDLIPPTIKVGSKPNYAELAA